MLSKDKRNTGTQHRLQQHGFNHEKFVTQRDFESVTALEMCGLRQGNAAGPSEA